MDPSTLGCHRAKTGRGTITCNRYYKENVLAWLEVQPKGCRPNRSLKKAKPARPTGRKFLLIETHIRNDVTARTEDAKRNNKVRGIPKKTRENAEYGVEGEDFVESPFSSYPLSAIFDWLKRPCFLLGDIIPGSQVRRHESSHVGGTTAAELASFWPCKDR